MGVRCRVRMDVPWAREYKGSRVGTGVARDTLASGRPQGRVGEDGILKGRYLCKRHIVCSWRWEAVQTWGVGWEGR